MRYKKIKISFLSLLLILFSFTVGCSTESTGSSNKEGEVVNIKFSTWQMDQEGYGEFWKEAINEFNETHENIKIEPYNHAPESYPDRLLVDIVGGNAPDLAMTAGFDFPQLAAMDAFESMDEYLDLDTEQFVENLMEYGKYDGKLVGFPVMARSLQLLYNKQLFEEAGISSPPENPNEFYDAVKALTDQSKNQYGFGFDTNNTRYLYEDALVWALGFGGQFSKDGKPTMTDPKTVEGIDFLKQLVDEKLVPQGVPKSDVRLGFAQGNIAMLIDGAWILPIVEEQNPDLMEHIGVASTPFESKVTTGGTMNLISITSQSQHKEEAAKFIEMISQPTWQQRWFELTNTMSAGKDVLTKDQIEDPVTAQFSSSLADAVPIAPDGLEVKYNEVSGIVQEKITAAFFTDRSLKELMEEAQLEIEELTSQ